MREVLVIFESKQLIVLTGFSPQLFILWLQDYSFTECVFNHVYKMAGCRLDWADNPKSTIKDCEGFKEIKMYTNMVNKMMNWNYATFAKETG